MNLFFIKVEPLRHEGTKNEYQSFGQVFNVGGTEEITILDLAYKIIDITESQSAIKMIPYDVAYEADFEDMERRVPSIEKVSDLIGFKPNEYLDDIIREIVAFMKKMNPKSTTNTKRYRSQ
jgi:UDP-glucose 4-epimerase